MIFSVQNRTLMYSVELLPDLVQMKVRQTVSEVFLAPMGIPIHVWPMVEVLRRDFIEHRILHVPITENQFGTMGMMSQIAEQVGMDYPDVYDSWSELVKDFLSPWEKEGSVERGFLNQEHQSANHQDNHPLCALSRPCKTLQLLDSSLICNKLGCCLVF